MRLNLSWAITTHQDIKDSPRRRVLEAWQIVGVPTFDGEETLHKLHGFTVLERDGFEPTCRHTATSPIVHCDGNIVTTASGSKYVLGTPRQNWVEKIGFELDPNCYVPEEYWNPWIEGDNWAKK